MTQLVVTDTGTFRVVPAEPWHNGALALVPLADEWTGRPPPVASARSLSAGVGAHVTRGTLVLTGLPERAWPHLSTTDQFVDVVLTRPGRAEQHARIRIPAASALPYRAAPLPVSSTTIALAGRVTASAFPHGPVVGASITLSGTPTAPVVAVGVPLASAHPAGTTVRLRPLPAVPTTSLTEAARAGDATVTLASTAGIGAGTVLRLATGEHTIVDAVTGTLALLRRPLRTSPADGSAVAIVTPGAPGAATTLTRDALAGDAVWPVAAALAGASVEVVDGAATEYRALGLTTDPDGRWRQPGVRGVAALRLTVSAAGFLTDGPTEHPLAPTDPFVIDVALRT